MEDSLNFGTKRHKDTQTAVFEEFLSQLKTALFPGIANGTEIFVVYNLSERVPLMFFIPFTILNNLISCLFVKLHSRY
jgi:hypothetical protein